MTTYSLCPAFHFSKHHSSIHHSSAQLYSETLAILSAVHHTLVTFPSLSLSLSHSQTTNTHTRARARAHTHTHPCQALDFKATTRLLGALTTKPISYAKDVAGNRDALDKAKFRTSAANATWVPKKESQQAETDVRMLTKHAWHIGAGYNIGVGHAEQHAFGTLGSHAGQEPPRLYEYAGLTVTKFTSSSGPLMSDQRKDARVTHMLGTKKVCMYVIYTYIYT